MLAAEQIAKYRPTIGIECHVQLKTVSKLFIRVSNDAREAEPNTTVSALCFGLPGVLPYLNQGAVNLAVRAGLALNATVNHFSKFDRKHYFYPDLPKGYQITQYDQPIISDGWVEVRDGADTVRVGIERAHLEEDAGKLTHPPAAEYTLVDLNRAGTPLLEIVSRPDIHSPQVAKAYAKELYLLMKYAGVSDVDLYHGHMRFDVNISLAPADSQALGTRAEIKNLNSFKAVEKAAQFEIERQAELLERGQPVVQETRGWHDDKQRTFSQRSKEEAHDYRYFPEPDLPPLNLSPAMIDEIKRSMPPGPRAYRQMLSAIGVETSAAADIVAVPELAAAVGSVNDEHGPEHAKRIAYWLLQGRAEDESELSYSIPADFKELVSLSAMVEQNRLSATAAKQVLTDMRATGSTAQASAAKLDLFQVTDTKLIDGYIDGVLADNPQAVADYQSGETKALGFLVGQVMNRSKGQADPSLVRERLLARLKS